MFPRPLGFSEDPSKKLRFAKAKRTEWAWTKVVPYFLYILLRRNAQNEKHISVLCVSLRRNGQSERGQNWFPIFFSHRMCVSLRRNARAQKGHCGRTSVFTFLAAKRAKNKRMRVSLRRNAHNAQTCAWNGRFTEAKSTSVHKDMLWVGGKQIF